MLMTILYWWLGIIPPTAALIIWAIRRHKRLYLKPVRRHAP